jgi:hypothetical protein
VMKSAATTVKVTSRVTITLEVEPHDTWEEKVTADQVFKQAKESAIGMVKSQLAGSHGRIRIVGVNASMIMVTE